MFKEAKAMRNKMLVIFLVAMILSLLVPIAGWYYDVEQAFTPNNLIRINVVSR